MNCWKYKEEERMNQTVKRIVDLLFEDTVENETQEHSMKS
jgi:hypothetical protein